MKKEVNKRCYLKPKCEVIGTITENLLQYSPTGQHNPAQKGSGPSEENARQVWFDEEEENNWSSLPWEDR